jgi:hypothetical protein
LVEDAMDTVKESKVDATGSNSMILGRFVTIVDSLSIYS